ncbi:hypothetical protein PIB30_065200 [Stylosanthes scabra]|uniref:Uncharacterized protein n=1 Tax=Stylosanthes scabra TaxID=79078 RepID=A0ABU6QN20_9FABA|nr:hypothetical protein [Stylosanthes scabra]
MAMSREATVSCVSGWVATWRNRDEEASTGNAAGGSLGAESADEDVGSESAEEEGGFGTADVDVGGEEDVEGEVDGSSPTKVTTVGIPTAAELMAREYEVAEQEAAHFAMHYHPTQVIYLPLLRPPAPLKNADGRIGGAALWMAYQGATIAGLVEERERIRVWVTLGSG